MPSQKAESMNLSGFCCYCTVKSRVCATGEHWRYAFIFSTFQNSLFLNASQPSNKYPAIAHASLLRMTETTPVLVGLAGNDLQRDALVVLGRRAGSLTGAVDAIARGFEERSRILNDEVDANQAAMSAAIDSGAGAEVTGAAAAAATG